MPERRVTRRGVLALVGAGAVAGCSALDGLTGDDEPTIRAYDLPDVDADNGEFPDPAVVQSVPVVVAPAHFAAARDRTTALLSDLPTPLGPASIPNGHVRQHVTDAAADATDALDEARTARSDLVALRELQHARESARYAAAGWAFVDEGLTVPDLRRERRATYAEATSFHEEREYVGRDPVRATLVHARVEEGVDRVTDADTVRPDHGSTDGLLAVAEWGEAAESARAHLDDARHLQTRYREDLPDDAGSVEDTLSTAAETLFADLRERRPDLPPEPTAEDWGPARRALDDLRWPFEGETLRADDAPGPASAVVDATGHLARFRALRALQAEVDAGETFRVETAEAVRRVRDEAYASLRRALRESDHSGLARTVVADAATDVASGDWELARLSGEVSAPRVDDAVASYVTGRALARATPEAVGQVVSALDG